MLLPTPGYRQHFSFDVSLGLCKVRTGWRRMADGGWRMADRKMRMGKCGWKNADDKMRMIKCGWKNADDKMGMKLKFPMTLCR